MKTKKHIKTCAALLLLLAMLLLTACGTGGSGGTSVVSTVPSPSSVSSGTVSESAESAADAESNAVEIEGDFSITTSDGEVTNNGNTYTVTKAGTYTLKGKLENGQIVVSAGDDDDVDLVLSGASLSNSSGAVILVQNASEVDLKAESGTYNTISDGRASGTTAEDDAAVWSACDLELVGSGSLVVTSNLKGIQSKDDLKIKNMTLKVTSSDTALQGNDSVAVESGNVIAISTGADAIKTTSSDVGSKNVQHGTVTLTGGTIELYACSDGIDAAYDASVSGEVSLKIATGSASSYTKGSASDSSCKGIKAANEILVSGGVIEIEASDDGLHANAGTTLENGASGLGNVTISGGSLTVKASDDGVHADAVLTIEGGNLNVTESHEGLEGHDIYVKGGESYVYGTDDGVNATASGRTSDGLISVSGGKLFVEVGGNDVDGIDSNGNYEQTGGFVVVSNPNANSGGMASATDVDGKISVTGGVIIALGAVPSSGVSGGGGRGFGRFGMGGMTTATVPSGAVTFTGTISAGTHTFTFGSVSESFTLKRSVSSGWIWADGISSSNYTID
ncbi:MAG: carbohydrate-binding domain-containing protein [Clostridia bacterium]|nr:carbohydrate-binding domain-containing protein [Clostridia bacterium]